MSRTRHRSPGRTFTVLLGLALLAVGLAAAVAQTSGRSLNVACAGNAAALQLAILQYAQDWDETLPPMDSAAAMQAAVRPYVQSPGVFICPATQTPYVPNGVLSHRSLAAVDGSPATVELFRDGLPHADGLPTVAYLDGHIERGGVNETDAEQNAFNNARSLNLGLLQYVQDYDETLPPMHTPAELKAALFPYVRSDGPFQDPVTGQAFRPNSSLSNRPVASFPDVSQVETFRSTRRHRNGRLIIGYLDGRVAGGPPPTPAGLNQQCVSDVRQISLALLQYTQDYDETLPPMHTPAELQTALLPYVHNTRPFTCPLTGQPYTPNAALSGHSVVEYASPVTTWTMRDAQAHPDGKTTAAYLDGHVRQ